MRQSGDTALTPPLGVMVFRLGQQPQPPSHRSATTAYGVCVHVCARVCRCVLTASVLCLCEAPRSAAAPPTGEAHPRYSTVHPYSLTHTPTHGGNTIRSDVCVLLRWRPAGRRQPLLPDLLLLLCKNHQTPATCEATKRRQNVPQCDSFLSPSRQKTKTRPCITASGATETRPCAPGLTSPRPGCRNTEMPDEMNPGQTGNYPEPGVFQIFVSLFLPSNQPIISPSFIPALQDALELTGHGAAEALLMLTLVL